MKRTNRTTLGSRGPAGFTLSELIVAVAAVALITLGVASVFQSTSETIRIGRANAELDTLASAIERVMREDFENINKDGFLVIRNRRITLPSGQNRRADEMAFFVNGNFSTAQYSTASFGGGVGNNVQSRVARVYYGHGVQLGPLVPWPQDPGNPEPYPTSTLEQALEDNALGVSSGRNSDPNKWAFLRQPLVLTHNITGREYLDSIFRGFEARDGDNGTSGEPPLASGLVDLARADMGENVTYVSTQSSSTEPENFSPNVLAWAGEETDRQMIMRMAQTMPHPRAGELDPADWVSVENWLSGGLSFRGEVVPTGLSRREMMLTRNTLAVGVSSCSIEWSYNGVAWYGLNTHITGQTKAPYPYRLMDKEGHPIENGLVIPINRLAVPNPTGGPANYTAMGLTYQERLFGFGLPSIDYLRDPLNWKQAGSPVLVRNTEVDPGTGFNPAYFDPQNVSGKGTPTHQWYQSDNDQLPDRLIVPLPRLVRVTITLSDHHGEFTDVPYTFTFEVPQPARLRQTDAGLQEIYQDPLGGGV
ncbi:MAG: type II secretion system protein [Phycisphaerales bacterium JB038]